MNLFSKGKPSQYIELYTSSLTMEAISTRNFVSRRLDFNLTAFLNENCRCRLSTMTQCPFDPAIPLI